MESLKDAYMHRKRGASIPRTCMAVKCIQGCHHCVALHCCLELQLGKHCAVAMRELFGTVRICFSIVLELRKTQNLTKFGTKEEA